VTWVKICGLTRREDVEVAVSAGADAIGLIMVPGTPRALSVADAAELARGVTAQTILLTRDLDPEAIVAAALATGVDGVQPYGEYVEEAAAAAAAAGLVVIRPVNRSDPASIPAGQLLLFDSESPEGLGGTGERRDPTSIPAVDRPFILAGGLSAENVGEAVRKVRPYGVDASSRLEIRPGVKHHDLVRSFVAGAKNA
jgi:phosphoribosylanthranilate isomerase